MPRLTQRELILRAESEKDLQAKVLELAKLTGWHAYHTWNSANSEAGFPDLLMVRGERLVVAELKRQAVTDTQIPAVQWQWIRELGAVPGVEAYLWRPGDWESIVEVLR